MLTIDQLAYTSKLRFVSPNLKAFFSITMLLMVVGFSFIPLGVFVIFLMAFITIKIGGISFGKYIKLLRIPLVFLLLSVITIIINITNEPLSRWYWQLGKLYVTTNQASLENAISLFVTAMAAVSCMYFLSLSTPMTDLLIVLKKIHCPFVIIELMLLIYRFIFILLDISHSLALSQKSRLGNRNLKTSIQSTGSLMAVLFLRAFRKSSALYDAMESRCYNGEINVLYEYKKATKVQICMVCITVIFVFIITIIINRYLPIIK